MQFAWLEQKDGLPSTNRGCAIGERTACAQQLAARSRRGPVLPLLQHLQHQGSSMQVSKQGPEYQDPEASQLHQRAALKWQEIQDRRGVLQPARPPPPPPEPASPLISERAARQRRREAAEDANPAAASSSAESDSEPEPALLLSPALSAQEFWREATRLGAQLHFGAWVKLAELAMVMVPGSVENERMFSTLKYIRNPQRNKLQAQHLTCCARGFRSSAFSVENFPYPEAIMEWLSAKKRRGIR